MRYSGKIPKRACRLLRVPQYRLTIGLACDKDVDLCSPVNSIARFHNIIILIGMFETEGTEIEQGAFRV